MIRTHSETPEEEPSMSSETVDTLIVGGGQAGLAMNEHLGRRGVPHIVLEWHRIAERWRDEIRWFPTVQPGTIDFLACPGNHDAAHPSSGASGTTQNTSPTT